MVALRSLLNVFACGKVSSPRLYRLKDNLQLFCVAEFIGRWTIYIFIVEDFSKNRIFFFNQESKRAKTRLVQRFCFQLKNYYEDCLNIWIIYNYHSVNFQYCASNCISYIGSIWFRRKTAKFWTDPPRIWRTLKLS